MTGPGRRNTRPTGRSSSPARRASAARRPEERRRTPGTGTPAARRPARTTGLTTRAAVLATIVCALLLALTVPMREYLAQRAEVARLEADVAARQRRVDALEARKLKLQDPAYVEQLARERLHFVRPGEIPYILLTPAPTPSASRVGGSDSQVVAPESAGAPWYSRLWSTVDTAGSAPGPSPRP